MCVVRVGGRIYVTDVTMTDGGRRRSTNVTRSSLTARPISSRLVDRLTCYHPRDGESALAIGECV